MLLRLYKSETFERETSAFPTELCKLKVLIFTPSFTRLSLHKENIFRLLFLHVLAVKGYNIIYLLDGDKIAHYSFITGKSIRFPFMSKNDLQIGPCFTYENYRGRGIYTQMLNSILKLYPINGSFWIYTAFHNKISKKAIEKVGFNYIDEAEPKSFLKILKLP